MNQILFQDLCAEVRPNAASAGAWGSKNCGAKQGFICQIFKGKNPVNKYFDQVNLFHMACYVTFYNVHYSLLT